MIQAIGLSKRYDNTDVLALDSLDLEVNGGELFCLLGANGAGKTTTVSLFLDFIKPTAGTAMIGGIEVSESPREAIRHASYVAENVMLYNDFTARENIEFFSRLNGTDRTSRSDLDAMLAMVGLPEASFGQRTRNFSKGMRQKLGIAVALTKNADAIFLDEPTSGLDPLSATDLMSLLVRLKDDGKAIFMCTHDIFRAHEYADRIGIMKAGRLVSDLCHDEVDGKDLEAIYLNYMRG